MTAMKNRDAIKQRMEEILGSNASTTLKSCSLNSTGS